MRGLFAKTDDYAEILMDLAQELKVMRDEPLEMRLEQKGIDPDEFCAMAAKAATQIDEFLTKHPLPLPTHSKVERQLGLNMAFSLGLLAGRGDA